MTCSSGYAAVLAFLQDFRITSLSCQKIMCDMIIMNNEHIYIQRLKLRFYFIKRGIRKGVKGDYTHTNNDT